MRDPMEELAELFLMNLSDWWAEVNAKEPRASASITVLPATRGISGNIVESFVFKRAEILEVLTGIRGVIKRLPAHLRKVYRLRYVKNRKREDIAWELKIGTRTVDHRLSIIRGRVAGRLRRFEEERLAGFWREIRRFLAR
jgi:DNA-directed RNA polymerase specialized sigma24 family protein